MIDINAHTRARVRKIPNPEKAFQGLKKGSQIWKKDFFASTVRNSMGLYIHIVFTSYGPQPMDGYSGVLGSH